MHAAPPTAAATRGSGGDEPVLALRDRLAGLLGRAAATAGDPARAATLANLAETAAEPFLLVALGAAGSGKAAFLEALFGTRIQAPAPVDPARVTWFKHGPEIDRALPGGVIECHRPAPFLRDFQMVDVTLPDDSAAPAALAEDFLPLADLVLVVLAADSPWSAAAWRFMENLHHVWWQRVAIVVTGRDRLANPAWQDLAASLATRLPQSGGKACRIFPVSARLAGEARAIMARRGSCPPGAWEASGFGALESHLRGQVGRFEARLLRLLNTAEAARRQLPPPPAAAPPTPPTPAADRIAGARRELQPLAIEVMRRLREAEVALPVMIAENLAGRPTLRALWRGDQVARQADRRLRGLLAEGAAACTREAAAVLVAALVPPESASQRRETAASRVDAALAPLAPGIDQAVAAIGLAGKLGPVLRRRLWTLRLMLAAGLMALGGGLWAFWSGLPGPAIAAAGAVVLAAWGCAALYAASTIETAVETAAAALEGGRERLKLTTTQALELAVTECLAGPVPAGLPDPRTGSPQATIATELAGITASIERWATAAAQLPACQPPRSSVE
jgi:hypothetical protein